jgi:hypothetical protein
MYTKGGAERIMQLSKPVLDPCVFVREPDGTWGYHNGWDVAELISSLRLNVPCERLLHDNLVTRVAWAMGTLFTTVLKYKAFQAEWFAKKVRAEQALPALKGPPEDAPPSDVVKFKEYMFAHYASFYESTYDVEAITVNARYEKELFIKNLRKLKDAVVEDCWDLHITAGWLRNDTVTRIRELSASTTASKLHGDIYSLPIFRAFSERSEFRRQWNIRSKKIQNVPMTALAPGETTEAIFANEDNVDDYRDDGDADAREQRMISDSLGGVDGGTKYLFYKPYKAIEQLHIVSGKAGIGSCCVIERPLL